MTDYYDVLTLTEIDKILELLTDLYFGEIRAHGTDSYKASRIKRMIEGLKRQRQSGLYLL